jgi:replication factor C subunit 3/5
MYGDKYRSMVLELNASDDRGIQVVREQIKSFASTKSMFKDHHKLIILDEADALTQAAQNSLRRVIEQYTKNTRFVMICNYVGKIIPALQSRCTRFRFAPLEKTQINDRLNHIIQSEQVQITPQAVDALLKLSMGDMRRALNILQVLIVLTKASFVGHEMVTEDAIYQTTGSPFPRDIEQITNWLFNSSFFDCYNSISI